MLLHRSDIKISKKNASEVLLFVSYFSDCFASLSSVEQFLSFSALFRENFSEFRDSQTNSAKLKLKISKYTRILIFCRYVGILALGEIKMKVEIF